MRLGPLIDMHQHPVPEVYKRALSRVGIHGSGENPWPAWSLPLQLELMDEMNIAAVVNSVASPGAYFGNVDEAIRIARECNDDAAKMISDHPHRLGAFALLPMPDVTASIREAAYALDTLKLEGICLLSHAGQRHLGHPDEDELYAELDRRNAVVFVHPLRNQANNMPAYSYPSGMTELVLDATRATHNLLWNERSENSPASAGSCPTGRTIPFLTYRLGAMGPQPGRPRAAARRHSAEHAAPALVRRRGDQRAGPAQVPDGSGRPDAHPVRQRLSVFPASRPGPGPQEHHRRLRGVQGLGRQNAPGHRARQRAGAVPEVGESDGREGLIFLAL